MGAIVLGILMFMFLVIIHELGHFFAAKKTWVTVHEFGIGIPPKAATVAKDKWWTEYTINWLPLGGFVRLKGEDPSIEEDFFADDSFITASLRRKIVILIAGVAVNTVFAWLAFSAAFWVGVAPISILPDSAMRHASQSYLMPSFSHLVNQWVISNDQIAKWVHVDAVDTEQLGARLWLQPGDRIVSVNGDIVTPLNLSTALRDAIGKSLTITIERNEQQQLLIGQCPEDDCILAITIGGIAMDNLQVKMPFDKAMLAGGKEVVEQTRLTFATLGTLGKNLFSFEQKKISSSVDKLSGPVWIVAFGQRLFYEAWWVSFLAFAGMISLALAIFNVLPIPALDGGRIVTAIIQAIGRFSPAKYFVWENYVNIFFFVLLMALGLFVIYKDIIRL